MKRILTLILILVFIGGGIYLFSNQRAEAPASPLPEPGINVSTSTPSSTQTPVNSNPSTPTNPGQNPSPAPNPSPNPSVSTGKCYVGGCSSQICSDEPDIVSTCEWREEYACYKTAKCERQTSGQCGWTPTAELNMCLKNSQSFTPEQVVY